ncbi:jg1763 [Pararge aegeria aegeria]|uniref:Jg1763 protein n=1 Tax=Pararge aegeria aegeria TaxID=348720 RepID=A0A8S4RRD8_9NEOP|nr:jg1763 [Pararge aegeria aegeria]
MFVGMDVIHKDFPYEIETLDAHKNEELTEYIRGYKEEFIRVGPKKYFFQKGYLSVAADIYNFPLRSDDTFVITYPKSGTTLTQELVWLICNNLDYEKAASTILSKRFPFLEVSALVPADKLSYMNEDQKDVMKNRLLPITIKGITELPAPRFIKSHMPLSLLPPSLLDNAKVVYMTRDPRDVAVSYYHHHKLMKMMKPDKEFKPFWNYFITDNMFSAPYFGHVLEAWEKRNHPNMLFLNYEEVVKDLPAAVGRVANFFDKTLSNEQVNKLAQHLDFDNFKKNTSVNLETLQQSGVFRRDGAFIRKGQPGDWRTYFDEEMIAQADEWIKKNLRQTDFRLPN